MDGVPGGGVALDRQVVAELASLDPLRREVTALLQRCGEGAAGVYRMELVLEELLTNIWRHGLRPGDDPMVRVALRVDDDAFTLKLADAGRPFDPTRAEPPPPPTSLDDARIGGLGLMLVRQTCRTMHYERLGGRNHLTVTLARVPAAPDPPLSAP